MSSLLGSLLLFDWGSVSLVVAVPLPPFSESQAFPLLVLVKGPGVGCIVIPTICGGVSPPLIGRAGHFLVEELVLVSGLLDPFRLFLVLFPVLRSDFWFFVLFVLGHSRLITIAGGGTLESY